MSPRVSVIMSVYNGQEHLGEAIESILVQTFTDFEFIIVDDGSTDSTWKILTSYHDERITPARSQQNLGLSKSLNRGLKIAKGDYIARQDADDVSLPARLTTQLEYLYQHNLVGLLGTAYHVVDAKGHCMATHRQPLTDTEIRWQMLFHNAFCHTSVMFRRELVDTGEPPYSRELRYSQDYDLWARLLRRTQAANLPAPLVAFRAHEASASATARDQQQRAASAIAAREVHRLVPQLQLTPSEINRLRHWYYKLPQRLSPQDMGLCRVLLQILDAFEKQDNVDDHIARRLHRLWVDRILAAVPVEPQRALWTSGLLAAMLRRDAASLVTHLGKRGIRRIARVVQIVSRLGLALTPSILSL